MFSWKIAIIFISPLLFAFHCGHSSTEIAQYTLSPCPESLPTFREDETSYITIDRKYRECVEIETYDSLFKDLRKDSVAEKLRPNTSFRFAAKLEKEKSCLFTLVLRAKFCAVGDKECENNPQASENSEKQKQRILNLWFTSQGIKATEVADQVLTYEKAAKLCERL
jgi:hypothetical protein